MPNTTVEYRLSFATPAFLGNAHQQAQWRTPPIKALIRQWWRVVKAPQVGFDVAELRAREGALFGTASDDGKEKSHRSRVRLRLSTWEDGKLVAWPLGEQSEFHPEVGEQGRKVGAELYLGYGPLGIQAGQTNLNVIRDSDKRRTAIDDKTSAALSVMLPAASHEELQAAIQLVAWFGTLGSRSRNGWGALQMADEKLKRLKPLSRANLSTLRVTRSLTECLKEEWPHAIGQDGTGPLVWKTRAVGDWRQVMKELARIKIAFRTQFKFESGRDGARIERRHVLAYPVTNHNPRAWGSQERLANQLRFKVAKTADGKLEGAIVHLPCKVPDDLLRKLDIRDQKFLRANELSVWEAVHAVLDNNATRLV